MAKSVNQTADIKEDVDRKTGQTTGAISTTGLHNGGSTTVAVESATPSQPVSGRSKGGSAASVDAAAKAAAKADAAAKAAAKAAEDQADEDERQRLAAEAQRRRNEKLAKDNSERIKKEALEKQASREEPRAAEAVSTQPVHAAPTPAQATAPRIEAISADEVADAGQILESQPMTASENLGLVDTDTGEIISTTPERSSVPAGVPSVPASEVGATPDVARSKMAEMVEAVQEAPQVGYAAARAAEEGGEQAQPKIPASPEAPGPEAAAAAAAAEQAANPAGEQQQQQQEAPAANAEEMSQDATWRSWQDITGLKSIVDMLKRLRSYEGQRQADTYKSMREDVSPENASFEAYEDGTFDYDPSKDLNETLLARSLRRARNKILSRFLNPSLLRIESEYVETQTRKVGGRTKTYGRIRYDARVEGAIGAVRRMYNCSIYNVMQLVQLRAGLGVDSHGKIGNVDPDKFKLTDDQFVELCRDICESQRKNGHPLGPVTGTPGGNGVRDDTGKFVVVAKTRCFPLGYMPTQLIKDLRRDVNSSLHNKSERQIQKMVGEQWINETYPQLCANTGGNLMFQARAIENMMRGLMMADGKNPEDLDIPEVVERQTLMALRAEAAATSDKDIADANEVKMAEMEGALSRMTHRFKKENGSRSSDGSINSASMKRRRNKFGDFLGNLSYLQKAAKAANLCIMISSIPEEGLANLEQGFANIISDSIFSSLHGDIAQSHAFTSELEALSQTAEAVEARDVAESLYRIGGHDALDAFFGELGDDGRAMNKLTRSDMKEFLKRMGVTGPGATVSDRVRQAFKVKDGEEAGFLSFVERVVNGVDDLMLSSNMFKSGESKRFVKMSMAEMGRSALHGRESFTSEQVAGWGRGAAGGEELVRSLLQTDAGREAFMTQGITSLGRKSPIEHQLRLVMAKNRLTEFAVRTMFDRFPEYGVNKVLRMVPFSNTMSYLTARGIKSVGDILATQGAKSGATLTTSVGEAMQRNFNYQAGARMSFAEGLRKNLMYDTIMAAEKLTMAGIYCGVILALGGVHPPEDERDRYTWSEWKIGTGDLAIPVKWAWWMDDLSGLGLPLGLAWAICEQGGWSSEAKGIATNTFINAVANFNSGTALFDAIDLVNNFDEEVDAALGGDVKSYDPDYNEWTMTSIEQGFWDLVGDMTPAFVGQLVPWSKDYIFREGDAHTASRVYDVGEGSKYTMEEAQKDYRTKQTGSYSEWMRRRSAQTNVLQAIFYDLFKDEDETGYKYDEQPLETQVDPYVQAMYDQFYLDLDPRTSDLPIEQEARKQELDARAEVVCQWIDDHYQNPTQAYLDGFVINYDQRVNCINYCYSKIDEAWQRYHEATDNVWLEDSDYERVVQDRDDAIDHYKNLIYNYFQSSEIPWTLPRYVRQETDREVRYVDSEGNAMTYLDTLPTGAQNAVDPVLNFMLGTVGLGDRVTTGEKAEAESYWYGNRPSPLPISSPVTQGKGHNYETIPYWVVIDDDGNIVNDTGAMYDRAGDMVAGMGRHEGKNLRELLWGGQGTNMGPEADEELRIGRDEAATLGGGGGAEGGRPWRLMEETFPEDLKNLDADKISEILGIPASLPTTEDQHANDSDGAKNGGGGGGGGYSGYSHYSGGGGGGGGYSNYNPRIYSSPRQVYSQRASGMQTRQPYKPTSTYLRPNFYTKGSREAYKRSDF